MKIHLDQEKPEKKYLTLFAMLIECSHCENWEQLQTLAIKISKREIDPERGIYPEGFNGIAKQFEFDSPNLVQPLVCMLLRNSARHVVLGCQAIIYETIRAAIPVQASFGDFAARVARIKESDIAGEHIINYSKQIESRLRNSGCTADRAGWGVQARRPLRNGVTDVVEGASLVSAVSEFYTANREVLDRLSLKIDTVVHIVNQRLSGISQFITDTSFIRGVVAHHHMAA